MHVEVTAKAVEVVERARRARAGELTVTIGTGCCESTAPFLFEDFWPGPDQEVVGDVAGVPVYAPEYLRRLYPGDEGVVIDLVDDVPAESMSIETEWGCRLILRGHGIDLGRDDVCVTPTETTATIATGGPSRVRGELPEALRRVRVR